MAIAATYRPRSTARCPRPLALAVSGVVVAALAGLGLGATAVTGAGEDARDPTPPSVPALQAPPLQVTVRAAAYAPGESSGWHAHPGVHTVIVRSGVLTVYDANCEAQAYGPDEPYVGGRQTHLARNEGPEPVEMTVVYASTGDGTGEAEALPAGGPPEGCAIS